MLTQAVGLVTSAAGVYSVFAKMFAGGASQLGEAAGPASTAGMAAMANLASATAAEPIAASILPAIFALPAGV